jgi:hypothetical protein
MSNIEINGINYKIGCETIIDPILGTDLKKNKTISISRPILLNSQIDLGIVSAINRRNKTKLTAEQINEQNLSKYCDELLSIRVYFEKNNIKFSEKDRDSLNCSYHIFLF